MLQTLYRVRDTLKLRGTSRSQHYRDISAGMFPKPVRMGKRASAWPESEIAALNAARIAGKSDAFIQELVRALEAARQGAAV